MNIKLNGFSFNTELENIWSNIIEQNSIPIISDRKKVQELFNDKILPKIEDFLKKGNSLLNNGFLIIKIPDKSKIDGLSTYHFKGVDNPYTEIRENYEPDINFSSLIYQKDSKIRSSFAFLIDNYSESVDQEITIFFKEKHLFPGKLVSIKNKLEDWKKAINNKEETNNYSRELSDLINYENEKISKIVKGLDDKLLNNKLYKSIRKSFLSPNKKDFNFRKAYIFFLKMFLSQGSFAIFKTTPLHLVGYKAPISLIWQINLPNNLKIKSSDLENIFIASNSLITLVERLFINKVMEDLSQHQLRTAIISILVDSFSHNISAHSLAALKWWFEQRSKILEKRIYSNETELILNNLNPNKILISQEERVETVGKYYSALNLRDSSYNEEYYSLFDYLQFAKDDMDIFKFSEKVSPKYGANDEEHFYPRFPVSLDYALFPFMRFLRDKGAFWSGVTRDMAFGGESKTLYQILWDDFANNPLYLGTIAFSEGVSILNIYLSIENDEGVKSGRFVTIDLSVINFENKLANQKGDNDKPSEGNQSKNVEDSLNPDCDESFIDHKNYSQYGFVRLGEKFSYFRKELSDEKYKVFLPGGIVGEHAMFTIIENTIRNIKHYKNDEFDIIKKNGINLYLSIKNDKKDKANDSFNKRFRIDVWLDHTTELSTIIQTSNGTVNKRLINLMKNKAESSIVSDVGAPRMGGNSQDKACAAMLLNNSFISVESKNTTLQEKYYPWIFFSENLQNGDSGLLKKHFYLWKSQEVLRFKGTNVSDLNELLKTENISRFKFFVSDGSVSDEMKRILRENGIIRILDNIKGGTCLSNIYKKWLEKWARLEFNNEDFSIVFRGGDDGTKIGGIKGVLWIKDNILVVNKQSIFPESVNFENNFYISHGGEKYYQCNIRSHGAFSQKFFKCNIDDFPRILININETREDEIEKNECLLLEFIETIKTKVVIFDSRMYERFRNYKEKEEMFKNQLNLEVYPENEKIFDKRTKNTDLLNIIIVHLSFIENMKDRNGEKYNEKRMVEFIENKFIENDENKLPENFLFVVTSGRGRDDWLDVIRSNGKYSVNTIFKPIETLLNAIESGVSYNDHFDIKYNLMKAIFGS